MKKRLGFVTNSSSASYIICFARIDNEEKANKVIKEMNLENFVFTKDEVDEQSFCGCIGADWAGATIFLGDNFDNHKNSKFIIIEDSNEASYGDYGDPVYDYDFAYGNKINAITEDNGFAAIETVVGEGRDG